MVLTTNKSEALELWKERTRRFQFYGAKKKIETRHDRSGLAPHGIAQHSTAPDWSLMYLFANAIHHRGQLIAVKKLSLLLLFVVFRVSNV